MVQDLCGTARRPHDLTGATGAVHTREGTASVDRNGRGATAVRGNLAGATTTPHPDDRQSRFVPGPDCAELAMATRNPAKRKRIFFTRILLASAQGSVGRLTHTSTPAARSKLDAFFDVIDGTIN